jgi:hypothetical protein
MLKVWVFHNISALHRFHKVIIILGLSARLCNQPLQIMGGAQDMFLRAEVRYEGLCDELAALLGGIVLVGHGQTVARN